MNLFVLTGQEEEFDLDQHMYDLIDQDVVDRQHDYTVYIPSKARSFCKHTADLLKASNIRYRVVVEPQDYDDYCEAYGSEEVLSMDKNDQGIYYARNWIKKYSTEIGEEKHWQMDDDMLSFKIRQKDATKNVKVPASKCVAIVERTTDLFSNIAISGLCSAVFAFAKKSPAKPNQLAYGCVLVDNSVDVFWRENTVEDWDYTFQVLEKGYCTLAFFHAMFDTVATMTMSGGNTEIHFEGDKRKKLYEDFIKLWPGRFELKEYPDSKKRWRLNHARRFFSDYKQTLIRK